MTTDHIDLASAATALLAIHGHLAERGIDHVASVTFTTDGMAVTIRGDFATLRKLPGGWLVVEKSFGPTLEEVGATLEKPVGPATVRLYTEDPALLATLPPSGDTFEVR